MRHPLAAIVLVAAFATSAWSTEFTQTVTFSPNQGVTIATPTQAAVSLTDDQLKLVVKCTGGLDCARVGVALIAPTGGSVPQALQAAGNSHTLNIPKAQLTSGIWKVTFTYNQVSIPSGDFTITADAGGGAQPSGTPPPAAPPQPSLYALLTYPCKYSGTLGAYDLKNNVADVVVTPLGRVIASNTEVFDENDTLRVTVMVHPDLVGRLKVERASAFRDRTEIRVLGEGASRSDILLQSDKTCVPATFELSNFAPGRGEVRISVLSDTLESTAVGNFDLYVDPLYAGIFSAGPIWTSVVDPEIGLVSNGTTNVISAKADSGHDLRYGAFFTPFLWGRRDVEKNRAWYKEHKLKYPYWHHINPTIGFPFDHVGDNALVGLSIDFPPGFVFTYGVHVGEIKELDTSSGLSLGSPFSGPEGAIPLVKDRVNDDFIAVTLDLRVFVRLLRTVVTGGTK